MPYGLYYFVKALCDNWKNNPVLDYLRNHVQFIIIPCVNPYGFNNLTYKNAVGVNLNRNYDYNFVSGTPGSDDYGGTAAFSEPETQIVRYLITSNMDALAAFDLHTNGQTNVLSYINMNWYSLPASADVFNDDVLKALYYAAGYTISSNTAHFIDEYSLDTQGHQCGQITFGTNDTAATFANWTREVKQILSITCEGFCGFPDELTDFTPEVQNANAEIISNFLANLIATLSKLI